MSTDSEAGLVDAYASLLTVTYATTTIMTLASYEYFLTLKYETELLWRRKWSAATWVFVTNRYVMLANAIFQMSPVSSQSCHNLGLMNLASFFIVDLVPLPTTIFNILRTFAMLRQNPRWLFLGWVLVAMYVFAFFSDLYLDIWQLWLYVDDPVLGASCFSAGFKISPTLYVRLNTAINTISIAGAAMVLAITVATTFSSGPTSSLTRSPDEFEPGSPPRRQFVLRRFVDFQQYQRGTCVRRHPSNQFVNTVLLLTTSIFPAVLLSRFIINLRQADSSGGNTSDARHISRFSAPNFRVPTFEAVVGNLGEPLDFAADYGDDDDFASDGAQEVEPQHQYIEETDGIDGNVYINIAEPSGSQSADLVSEGLPKDNVSQGTAY